MGERKARNVSMNVFVKGRSTPMSKSLNREANYETHLHETRL